MRAALLILLALLPHALSAAGLDQTLREELARSVVQVQGIGCPAMQGTERRVATGFAYGPTGHIATANHVVAGCQRVTVYWEKHGGETQVAQVVRVLPNADLALLQVSQTLGQALTANTQRPAVDAELETLGYYLAVPTMSNKQLRVTFGSARLADMVPAETRQALEQSGTIDVNLDILRLDGHLLPGHSGAPIFNLNGQVVGVGSGGLKSGAASVSWAVPASYLAALLVSQQRQANVMSSATLFANATADPAPTSASPSAGATRPELIQVTCGGVQFIYTGVRSFSELIVGHEDLGSVQKLMVDFDLRADQVAQFHYHTFQPVDGGAAVAIPDWTSIRNSGQVCQAMDTSGRISVDFAGHLVQSYPQGQLASQQFEYEFALRSARQWGISPEYSYISPYQRDDGLTVVRRTYAAINPQLLTSLAFEPLLLHQPMRASYATFTGIIGVYWDFNLQNIAYCEHRQSDPACAPYFSEAQNAAQMIFGVLLSTAPRF